MESRARLDAIACAVRAFLEPVWPGWHALRGGQPDLGSRWTCGRSSLMLQRVLCDDFGMAARWTSGTPRHADGAPELGPYGFLCDGRWESHAWVVVDRWIVDVTADQFWAPPVLVTTLTDPRYGEGTGDTASPDSIARRTTTIEALWPIWLGSGARRALRSG